VVLGQPLATHVRRVLKYRLSRGNTAAGFIGKGETCQKRRDTEELIRVASSAFLSGRERVCEELLGFGNTTLKDEQFGTKIQRKEGKRMCPTELRA
jgi:hypothetical protein